MSLLLSQSSFKTEQKRYSRVRTAYNEKEVLIKETLLNKNLDINKLEIYIRAFKEDKKLELWGKNKRDEKFQLIKEFNVCTTCGDIGPKRKQGDLQIPEGYYHIDRFNPFSNFYLSLGINYPNKSDRILGVKGKLGGDIFIHGSCVTIGCLPIRDKYIKELYIYCVEAKSNGQMKIPVTIFPTYLNDENYKKLEDKYEDPDKLNLWEDLKKGYDYFNTNKQLPSISFLNSGRHLINGE